MFWSVFHGFRLISMFSYGFNGIRRYSIVFDGIRRYSTVSDYIILIFFEYSWIFVGYLWISSETVSDIMLCCCEIAAILKSQVELTVGEFPQVSVSYFPPVFTRWFSCDVNGSGSCGTWASGPVQRVLKLGGLHRSWSQQYCWGSAGLIQSRKGPGPWNTSKP